MTDLFDIPESQPSRLALARLALERAEMALEAAENADEYDDEGLPVGLRPRRAAVAAARYELAQAEREALGR